MKTGRPKLKNARTVRYVLRLTRLEHQLLQVQAAVRGVPIAVHIRERLAIRECDWDPTAAPAGTGAGVPRCTGAAPEPRADTEAAR